MTPETKTCFKCLSVKPISEYYSHKQMADGHLNKCKDCTKNDSWKRRHLSGSREKVLAYDRDRGNRQTSEYRQEFRSRKPVESKARHTLGNAVRDGKVNRPERCEHCHQKGVMHGHHYDYSKPLDVVWLCPACHRQLHALMDTVERAKERVVLRTPQG